VSALLTEELLEKIMLAKTKPKQTKPIRSSTI
jgi:hypothetical protein